MGKKHKIFLWILSTLAVCIVVYFLFLQYQSRKTQTILNLTTGQKLSDFDTLCAILDTSYPFWDDIEQAGIDKETVYSTYRTDIANTDTDIEFFKCIDRFLKEFDGFGHLSVLDGYMYGLYIDTISKSKNMLTVQIPKSVAPLS